MKKIISLIIIALLLLGMIIPASAYGFNVGAIQGSVSHAVEQEVSRNPDWFEDWVEALFARYH